VTATSMVRLRAAAIRMADSPIRCPFKLGGLGRLPLGTLLI
jgi:hypothetical protein